MFFHMKGNIKLAKVSIKYKKKTKERRMELIRTAPVEILIVIDETKRILKFKSRTISKVCQELSLNKDKVIDPDINTIEIIKDLGRTAYDI